MLRKGAFFTSCDLWYGFLGKGNMENANPYQKPAPMTKAQAELIQKENELRNQFAEKRNTPMDPHILLHNVYGSSLSFDYQPEDEEEV
jgi:hypothetical protein